MHEVQREARQEVVNEAVVVHQPPREDADKQEVARLEEPVVLPPHERKRQHPHREGAQTGHEPGGDVDPAALVVKRRVHGVSPPVLLDVVCHVERTVQEKAEEGEVPHGGVVQHGALKRDSDGGPDLAVTRDWDKHQAELNRGDEPHVLGDIFQAAVIPQEGREQGGGRGYMNLLGGGSLRSGCIILGYELRYVGYIGGLNGSPLACLPQAATLRDGVFVECHEK